MLILVDKRLGNANEGWVVEDFQVGLKISAIGSEIVHVQMQDGEFSKGRRQLAQPRFGAGRCFELDDALRRDIASAARGPRRL